MSYTHNFINEKYIIIKKYINIFYGDLYFRTVGKYFW